MAPRKALAACRVAAEQRMPKAIAAEKTLRALMTHESGALEGFASARHDLWRLARLAISLRDATGRGEGDARNAKALRKSAKQFAKRLRRALVGYVRAAVRSDGSTGAAIAEARRAALDELGLDRGAATGSTDASGGSTSPTFGAGLSRGLYDLAADWSDAGPSDAKGGPAHLSQPMISLDLTFGRIIRRLSRRTERQIRRVA
jgi:hypothetical protein